MSSSNPFALLASDDEGEPKAVAAAEPVKKTAAAPKKAAVGGGAPSAGAKKPRSSTASDTPVERDSRARDTRSHGTGGGNPKGKGPNDRKSKDPKRWDMSPPPTQTLDPYTPYASAPRTRPHYGPPAAAVDAAPPIAIALYARVGREPHGVAVPSPVYMAAVVSIPMAISPSSLMPRIHCRLGNKCLYLDA